MIKFLLSIFTVLLLFSCQTEESGMEAVDTSAPSIKNQNPPANTTDSSTDSSSDSTTDNTTDSSTTSTDDGCVLYELYTERPDCAVTLSLSNEVSIRTQNSNRIITSNNIPEHKVGLFGGGIGSLNPNSISEQNSTYTISLNPVAAENFTNLVNENGNQYSFGVLLNGVELDPVPAEPWPHEGLMSPNANWDWNLEAPNVNIGMDCNIAHVQPTGKYHYHGMSALYLESIDISDSQMTLVGYAGDGYPIYYKYVYSDASDASSEVVAISSSYQLKTGERPGDGVTAPCGAYTGVYGNDHEYIESLSELDEANGRTGVTPEYPNGTYYYVITDTYPWIPRYFRATPSKDFKIGPS